MDKQNNLAERAQVAEGLPGWEQVSAKLARGQTLTPLEVFVHENEPGGDAAVAWRNQLSAALASPAPSERDPVGDERAALEKWMVVDGDMRDPEGLITYHAAAFREGLAVARAALVSAPVAKPCPVEEQPDGTVTPVDPVDMASAHVSAEARKGLPPAKCPITGRPFFMALEHPELGMVPTYGGPYDSYTIPHLDGKPDQPWHERELRVYRYDHDLGGWRTDEVEVLPLRIINEDVLHGLEDAAPQASPAADGRDAKDVGLPDVLDAALNNLLHDNYERSYSGGKNREADVALIRAAIAAQQGEGGE